MKAYFGVLSLAAALLCTVGRADDSPAKGKSTGVIFGKVVDAAGAPLAEAQVSLYRDESLNKRFCRWVAACKPVIADEVGTYQIEKLPSGDTL